MPRQCIFCNATDLTAEDIWPAWFKRWLQQHPKLPKTFTLTGGDGETMMILKKNTQSVGGRRAIMCLRCNSRRMGRIQEQASVVLKPMLNFTFQGSGPDHPIVLTRTDQSTLAAWAMMTAMTSEFLPQPIPDVNETYFTQKERTGFRKSRKPIANVIVTASQYSGQNATGAYFAHSLPHILNPDTGEPTGKMARLYVVTIALFRVCFQLTFYRKPIMWYVRNGQSILGVGANPGGIEIPIWPFRGTQTWPPEYAIGDDTFLLYCQRWNPPNESDPAVGEPGTG
jgi:hypothetical protein